MTTVDAESQGRLLWSGEHWIAYLRDIDSDQDTGMVSLYSAYASPAGRGTAAFVEIPGDNGFKGLCTDNVAFAEFARTQVVPSSPFDHEMPTVEAKLERDGDTRLSASWTIRTGQHEIGVSWQSLQEPIVGPPIPHPKIVFTILVFADAGSICLDRMIVSGDPFLRQAWAASLGRPMSSFCFALAETVIQ